MLKSNKSVASLLQVLSGLQLQSRCASYANRESRMLQKLMSGKRRPSFKYGDQHTIKKPVSINEPTKGPTKLSNRRTAVLNKMFMRHITDLIASGPIGYELSGLGLEITRITVCQNYHGLNIFWTASGTHDMDFVEQKLTSINKQLRHELHQMQLMGNVPHLTFVRDEQVSYFDALDAAIANADYGDDFEPSYGKSKHNNDFEVQDDKAVATEFTLLPMRQDVFGLDHALIMGRVKQSMAKTQQAWKAYENKQTNLTSSKPFTFTTSFESIRQEQISDKNSADVLKEFLQHRKLLRKLKRAEQAEYNASQMIDDEMDNLNNVDDVDDSSDWLEDETEVQKFYDEYESIDEK